MNLQEFDRIVDEFVSFQDNTREVASCQTRSERAIDVLALLRNHLFADTIEAAKRYDQYLALKAEFEPADNGLY